MEDVQKTIMNWDEPMYITSSLDEDGRTNLTIAIQGDEERIWNNDLRLAAINHLIHSLDFKPMIEMDRTLPDKYYLSILDAIGNLMSWYEPVDRGSRNIEKVALFLQYMMESGQLEKYEAEGLIDQKEEYDEL
ncbi:hypothetical protein [Paenibacillus sp. NPDC093718]|uniref:hypothetical protein n=1 Tax=Paenibacillus sp. NPDC093718 TaxID=3390601 RepID=UPI003CFFC5F5